MVGLDRNGRRVLLSDGRWGPYEGLVIATGVKPRRLPDTPLGGRVLTLNTIDDAVRARTFAHRARSILIIGGGLIGTETAATFRAAGVPVTVLDIGPTLLHDAVGPQVGAAITALHRARGVIVRTGVTVRAWEQRRDNVSATLSDGTEVTADMALIAVGSAPDVAWLSGSGIEAGNGVACGPTTHVIGTDDIVACGDCASWPNLRFDAIPRRSEQWATAISMARHAADALLDGRDASRPFTPIPWGWTEQWGVRLHLLGRPVDGRQGTIDGDPNRLRGAVRTHDAQGRLVGAVVADNPTLTVALHRAIAAACPRPQTRPAPAA